LSVAQDADHLNQLKRTASRVGAVHGRAASNQKQLTNLEGAPPEAFVAALDLAEMSFEGVEPAATGRPSYHPSVLLKLTFTVI
jgi:hypothetical protein